MMLSQQFIDFLKDILLILEFKSQNISLIENKYKQLILRVMLEKVINIQGEKGKEYNQKIDLEISSIGKDESKNRELVLSYISDFTEKEIAEIVLDSCNEVLHEMLNPLLRNANDEQRVQINRKLNEYTDIKIFLNL
jgi:hypothetical protein